MPRTARARFFRSVSALGSAVGAGLNTATVTSYPAAGTNSTARFLPNASRAPGLTAFPAQVVGSYANEGYRDDVAQDGTNRVTYATGTWTIRLRVYKNNGITQPNQDVQFSCYVYIVTPSNVPGSIAFVATSAVTTLIGTDNAQVVTMSAAAGALSLSPGDKFHVEVYVQTSTAGVVAAPALATTVSFLVDDPSTSLASMFTAQPDFTIQFARSVADAASASDAAARATVRARALADSAPAADSLVRVARRFRSIADTAAAADAVSRLAVRPRSLTDSAPASDAVARSTINARALADAAAATDVAGRSVAYARQLADSAPAADTVQRLAVRSRAAADAAPATDTVLRTLALARAVADIAVAVDSVQRVINYVRGVEDNIGPSGGGGGGPVTEAEMNSIAVKAANAVWDELTAEARTTGSYGAFVVAQLDAAVSTRASQTSLTTVQGLVDDLEGRLTSARALLLDNLDAAVSTRATSGAVAALGAPAQATALTTLQGLVDDLESRLSAARALLLDNLNVAVSTRATPADVAGGSTSVHADIS